MISTKKMMLVGLSIAYGLSATMFGVNQKAVAANSYDETRSDQQSFAVPTACRSEEEIARSELKTKANKLLVNRQFDELEKLAQDLLTNTVINPDGTWELSDFYNVLSGNRTDQSFDWTSFLDNFKAWMTEKPKSATARLAYAGALINYAWKARGGGWASSVSEAGWKDFRARLKLAHQLIDEARELNPADPAAAAELETVLRGEEAIRATFDSVFDAAIKQEPVYYGYYFKRALYLLPRWYGKEGEWQEFAKNVADRFGGDAGDILYARIVWSLYGYFSCIMNEPGLDKSRALRGFELLVQKYPNSLAVLSMDCLMNAQANEAGPAASLMRKLHNRVDMAVWRDMSYFKRIQNALSQQ